jgi:trigger factor
MDIQVKEIAPCVLEVKYTADADEVKAKTNEVLNIFKGATVPGFRKGKAPLKSIHMRYLKQIQDATKKALQEDAYHNTLFDQGIKPFGLPEVKDANLADTFSCEMIIRKKPEVQLNTYKDMVFEIDPPRNVDAEYEAAKAQFCLEKAETKLLSPGDTVSLTDQVEISYNTFADGERVEDLCREKERFTLGETKLPGFDAQVLTMKVGETKDIILTGPETAIPAIAGKALKIEATLVGGIHRSPPEWNEELATRLSFESLTKLEESIRTQVINKVQENFSAKTKDLVGTALVNNNPVEPPDFMIDSEAQYLAGQYKMEWDKMPDVMKDSMRSMATANVKLALVCEAIRETDPDCQMTLDEVNRQLQKQLKTLDYSKLLSEGQTMNELFNYLRQVGYLDFMGQRIRDEHVLETVLNSCKFVPPKTDAEVPVEVQAV